MTPFDASFCQAQILRPQAMHFFITLEKNALVFSAGATISIQTGQDRDFSSERKIYQKVSTFQGFRSSGEDAAGAAASGRMLLVLS
jgi:hypothetical protein